MLRASALYMSDTAQKLVIDYPIHYVRAGGCSAAKNFKLKSLILGAREPTSVSKRQVIHDISTRKHNAGLHRIELQINGDRGGKQRFQSLVQQIDRDQI